MRRGFTLLELMVAALLLSMLTMILTMIFNQSSIAWTTGVATVASLGDVRQEIAGYLKRADNTLEGSGGSRQGLQVVSVWGASGASDVLRTDGRTLDLGGISEFRVEDESGHLPGGPINITNNGGDYGAKGQQRATSGKDAYVVGVASNGPDGEEETWDDISTFPEDQL